MALSGEIIYYCVNKLVIEFQLNCLDFLRKINSVLIRI